MLTVVATLQLMLGSTALVVNVSAQDAVYGDTAEQLAQPVLAALKSAGFDAKYIDESETCTEGPCLGQLAAEHHADVVVAFDASDRPANKSGKPGKPLADNEFEVSVLALKGTNGMPLTGKRYRSVVGTVPKNALKAFISELKTALTTPDAGPAVFH